MKNSNKVFGFNKIILNNTKIFTINVKTNCDVITLVKTEEDKFWKNRYLKSMENGKSKLSFTFTTLNEQEFINAKQALIKILFVHKVQKLLNGSYIPQREMYALVQQTISDVKDINNSIPFETDIF